MKIHVTQHEKYDLVRLKGPRLDAYHALSFKEVALKLAAKAERDIVVDMAEIDFIDSSGLGVLVAVSKAISEKHEVRFVNVQPLVNKVFRLTHMDRVFSIIDASTLEETAA